MDAAQVAVWIDHKEAHVIHVDKSKFDESTLHAPHHVHRHPRSNEKNHPDDEQHFFHEVAQALAGAEQVLVLGPSTAKLHFLTYVEKHDAKLRQRIVGIETADHPTDKQIAAHVRSYFLAGEHATLPQT
jgi:stalled ribosome rescue protein Dom34